MKIDLKTTIGLRCITSKDGQKLYDDIHEELKKGNSITLNFDGVSQFASPFFNYAIGQLLSDISQEEMRKLLLIEHLTPTGEIVLKKVIENAAQYHGNADYQKIVDDILKAQAEEDI